MIQKNRDVTSEAFIAPNRRIRINFTRYKLNSNLGSFALFLATFLLLFSLFLFLFSPPYNHQHSNVWSYCLWSSPPSPTPQNNGPVYHV